MLIEEKEVKHLLNRIRKANRRKRKPGDAVLEFALVVKQPAGASGLMKIITGTVPASFRYDPRTPHKTRKRR